ncbi:MAG: family 78 glycoside hydrolase catalytic domain [Bariatricus sp.]
MLKIKEIKCCGLKDPVGLKERNVYFTWKLLSDRQEVYQKSYRILVYDLARDTLVWDSGLVESEIQEAVYSGVSLKSTVPYRYRIQVTDCYGDSTESSDAYFTLGMMQDEWKARWIGCQSSDLDADVKMPDKKEMVRGFLAMTSGQENSYEPDRRLDPCNVYQKKFILKGLPESGWLSITAHGLYDVYINGMPVTDTRLNPGFTAYDKYLEFQTYDVTSLLNKGENTISIVLADGWYKGKYGLLGGGNNYGAELAVLAQLEARYKDSESEWILTDDTFSYRKSRYIYSDIMIGEKQDGRIDMAKIYADSMDSSEWKRAEIKDYGYDILCGICCEPVRCTRILPVVSIFTTPKGELIADMGQNMVGVVRLAVEGPAGTEIKLEHSEVLDKEGNFINNITGINRDQTDYYILSGKGTEVFEPRFTFHGFRYVKITGYPGDLTPDKIQGIVIGSDLEESGDFSCSDSRISQLQKNIQWSQRGNMLSIPTDCPQRERAGWTGDILVYGRTAAYNQNVKNFLGKWLENTELEQFDNGLIPIVVPYPIGYSAMQLEVFGTETSAGWGDAAVVVPWTLYQAYGELDILKKNFAMMKKWMDYVERDASEHAPDTEKTRSFEEQERQKYLWNTGFHFGDWCYPSCQNEKGETDMFQSAMRTKEYVATTMYAHSTRIMKEVCEVLGDHALAEHYHKLNEKIRQAFAEEYLNPDGSITGATQGIYVLAIAMEMGTSKQLKEMTKHLVRLIRENGYRLDTGFMSIPHLMDVLVEQGYADVAKELLYQEQCPSWLYEVKNGATTIWETWNAILEDGTRTSYSYNHYAFGCIGDWMYRRLLGIQSKEAGYRKIRIAPEFHYGLTSAEGFYESRYGKIACKWKISHGKGTLKISVPVGTDAEIILPGIHEQRGSGEYEYTFSAMES